MQDPQIGQRWLVDTESSLGLGIVVDCADRHLTLEFPATGERRQYSKYNAPLTRAVFDEGDTIATEDGQAHRISRVETINDLLIYISDDGEPIPESRLAATLQLNHPLKRLLAGQLDKPDWFTVRENLALGYQSWRRSELEGLIGARINLTPHQLYVAHAATSRFPVRVLLADEVGLGKTIEAGLILQRLQHRGEVNRALILVPEALCVQWFVELLRCFSIHGVLVAPETDLNDSRVFIASHAMLEDPRSLTEEAWDIVIVDEAHHFDLNADEPQGQHFRQLADHCTHLLLLTATPERLGLASHFARLQVLDGDKFHDFAAFQDSYHSYQSLADDLNTLLDDPAEQLSDEQWQTLQQHFGFAQDLNLSKAALTEVLLDTHGTGRMVYRNTRHGVSGFPKRRLISHPLEGQEQKREWLADFIKAHRDEKLLLIAHQKEDILELKEWLYRNAGIDCPVFHESMTLVERDRAAAYFADSDEGAPILLCSEIGSEGRNFQFCHRLICWDLPEHPDVLDQRIGRLDRIGQTQDIEIHVCIEDEHAAQRLHWFHDVLAAIEHINPAAGTVHDNWYRDYCHNPQGLEPQVKDELNQLLNELEQGRDRLLEMNSCRQPQAQALVDRIRQQEFDNNPQELLENLADVLNLHYEQLADNRFYLVPSDQMLVPMIPGIPTEGCEITFDRVTASSREDLQFVSWDHPLLQGLAEMIGISELGVASIGVLPTTKLKPAMLFAEVLFTLTAQSEHHQEMERYLTESVLRIVVTVDNPKDLSQALPSEQLSTLITSASKAIQKALVKDGAKTISQLVDRAGQLAAEKMAGIIAESITHLNERTQLECARLEQLQQHNADITADSIQVLKSHCSDVAKALQDDCQPVLSAIRLLVTDKPQR